MINKTELMALELLKKRGYSSNQIIQNNVSSPDFVCTDGSRYEVKFLYGNKLLFSKLQCEELKDEDIILVFDKNNLIKEFKWKDRDLVHFKIIITPNTCFINVCTDLEFRNKVKQYAEQDNRSISLFVIVAIEKYIRELDQENIFKEEMLKKGDCLYGY